MKNSNHQQNNRYTNKLDDQVHQVQNMVVANKISPRLASFLIGYLIKKDVKNVVRETYDLLLGEGNKDKVFMFGYDKKTTKYI